jgi:hypothetical protein
MTVAESTSLLDQVNRLVGKIKSVNEIIAKNSIEQCMLMNQARVILMVADYTEIDGLDDHELYTALGNLQILVDQFDS